MEKVKPATITEVPAADLQLNINFASTNLFTLTACADSLLQ